MVNQHLREIISQMRNEQNVPIKRIARNLGISRNTVKRCLQPRDPRPAARSLARLFLEQNKPSLQELYLSCEMRCPPLRRLIKAKHDVDVPLRMLQRFFAPQRAECRRLRALEQAGKRFETGPGQHLQIDFGQKVVRIGRQSALVHVFVCKLAYSRRIFAKMYWQETQSTWLDGIESALRYFDGVPFAIVCDNAASLVRNHYASNEADRFTARFLNLCHYYGIKPIATKVYYPQAYLQKQIIFKMTLNPLSARLIGSGFEDNYLNPQ